MVADASPIKTDTIWANAHEAQESEAEEGTLLRYLSIEASEVPKLCKRSQDSALERLQNHSSSLIHLTNPSWPPSRQVDTIMTKLRVISAAPKVSSRPSSITVLVYRCQQLYVLFEHFPAYYASILRHADNQQTIINRYWERYCRAPIRLPSHYHFTFWKMISLGYVHITFMKIDQLPTMQIGGHMNRLLVARENPRLNRIHNEWVYQWRPKGRSRKHLKDRFCW